MGRIGRSQKRVKLSDIGQLDSRLLVNIRTIQSVRTALASGGEGM